MVVLLSVQLKVKSALGTVRAAANWPFYWLCALILSFAYEQPLVYLTPYDRTNPRLFDVLVIVGVVAVLPLRGQSHYVSRTFNIWRSLVAWFCFCALVWAIGELPWDYGMYSIFRALTYLEGLIALYIALRIPLDERRKWILHGLMVICGVFVAAYCILEYQQGFTAVIVRPDLEVQIEKGSLVGPFGSSYFQLAQTQSLFFVFAMTFRYARNGTLSNALLPIVALFIGWPLMSSGSRTGLGLALLAVCILFFLDRRLLGSLKFSPLLVLLALSVFDYDFFSQIFSDSYTIKRAVEMGDTENSLLKRMETVFGFSQVQYKAGAMLYFLGGGFYVSPVIDGGVERYRIDYGVHSLFLFPFEQAGIIGFILFIRFAASALRTMRKCRLSIGGSDRDFSNAVLAYFVASLLVGVGGHNFWQGFDSGNVNTLILLAILMAAKPTQQLSETGR